MAATSIAPQTSRAGRRGLSDGLHCRAGVVLLALLAGDCGLFGAAANRNYTSSGTELYVDNVNCGPVKKWEGGDPVGEVTEMAVGNGIKKQITQVTYSPIKVVVPGDLPAPLVAWINDLCSGGSATKTVMLVESASTPNGTATELTAIDARLVEVDVPDLDASSKDALELTLVIAPSRTIESPATNPPATPGQRVRALLSADFQLQIGGLDTSKVKKIGAFMITNQVVSDQVGQQRTAKQEPTGTHFSNLNLELSATDAIVANWMAWRKDFLIDRNYGDAAEKSGSLTLGRINSPAVLTLQFSHLGLVRAWQSAASAQDSVKTLQAELYYETMAFTGAKGGAPAAEAGTDTSADTTATATDSTPATDAQQATLAAAAPAAPTSAQDVGERDPADFPRYPGSVRKSYTIIRQVGTAAEYVVYETPDPVKAVADFFDKHLAPAGWTQAMATQSTDSDNKPVFVQTWQKATRSAMISAGSGGETGTKIAVVLNTAGPGGN